ncbi:uncharacterized protein PHACADRAFT_196028 [Phanerochaete carnosa HHB-10118-sp]|uniref:Uncharacterized protein n=1 Tax=Phanerochaete carnosa (strain HHB-10118-sp) TaxID=650164 RepID=K5VWP9_PHACS|nr:uncharacterized protein PHACADRAFT_196028 [Phanerochaete carnosa HHB-10118-sp]EKM55978.1 hypothetical protein PHACADRAFT_196028 [Phanerochaete carnosa HHB-10118-sp]
MDARGPLKGTFDRLCTVYGTKLTAWKYYKNLKKIRPGADDTALPDGYMSICAFIAAENTCNFDVTFRSAYAQAELKSEVQFWRHLDEVEEILLAANNNTEQPRIYYSRLSTFDPPCPHCRQNDTKCYRVHAVGGKRTSKKCNPCFQAHRPCTPIRNEDEDSENDSKWSPPRKKKSIEERCNRIEKREEKQTQKRQTMSTECPKLPPFSGSFPANRTQEPSSSSSSSSEPPAVSRFTSSSSKQTSVRSGTANKARPSQSSSSKAATKPGAVPAEPTATQSLDPSQGPSRRPADNERQPLISSNMPPDGKTSPAPSLNAFRKPGPGRSSQGFVTSTPAVRQSTPPDEKRATDSMLVTGPFSMPLQPVKPHSSTGGVKNERSNNSPGQSSGRASTTFPVIPSAAPTSASKQERPVKPSGSGLGSESARSRRASAAQVPTAQRSQAQITPSVPAPQNQPPEVPHFSFTPVNGLSGYGGVEIPTTLEPAFESTPTPRPSPRGRLVGTPKTVSPGADGDQIGTIPVKRPSEDMDTQTRKKRKTNAVGLATTRVQSAFLPASHSTIASAAQSSSGAQPTPPHSINHTPVADDSASQPPPPTPTPANLLASLSFVKSQLPRQIEELPCQPRASVPTRLPTPVSPTTPFAISGGSPIPGSAETVRHEASRCSRQASPQRPSDPRLLPTPRSSMSAPIHTPPTTPAGLPKPALSTPEQDAIMQGSVSAPPEPKTPQLPSWAQISASAHPPPSASASPALPAPNPPPTHALATPPISAHNSAPASSFMSPTHKQYLSSVSRKAQEIDRHVAVNACAHLDLFFAISDMARRAAKFDALLLRHAQESAVNALGGMLRRAGGEVVERWKEVQARGEEVADDVLDILLEDLEERLEKMENERV